MATLYFPHIIFTDKKSMTLQILEDTYGDSGYAAWFRLLELLALQENNYLDLSDPQNVALLISHLKMDKKKVTEILATIHHKCYQFDPTLFAKKILYIPKLRGSVKQVRGPSKVDASNFLLDDQKTEMVKNVFLTKEEYEKLLPLCDNNETIRKRVMEILSAYKSQSLANKNRYDSDYAAMGNWVITRAKEEFAKSQSKPYASYSAPQHKESKGAHQTNY
jgi:hypothetical protein